MRTLEEAEKELQQTKDAIQAILEEARSKVDGLNDDAVLKWYGDMVEPFNLRQDELEDEIYRIKLFSLDVGDGVTIGTWTDRYAYSVIKRTPKTITIQRDNAIRTDHNGMSECQEYRYEPDLEGQVLTFKWSEKKHRWVHSCYGLSLGRHEYYDYSF